MARYPVCGVYPGPEAVVDGAVQRGVGQERHGQRHHAHYHKCVQQHVLHTIFRDTLSLRLYLRNVPPRPKRLFRVALSKDRLEVF